ncbi:Clp protease N-terminal domain-containing protein [Agromyces bauzanensis]
MFERFARSARAAVEDARYEAQRRGDRRVGTEHLLFALLQDDALAEIVGVDAAAAQRAADQLDRAALAAIGLNLGDVQPIGSATLGRHVPLMTSGAKTVLRQTLANASAEKARAITSRHLMLALLDRREPDPAAVLFAALRVDQAVLRERLAAAA